MFRTHLLIVASSLVLSASAALAGEIDTYACSPETADRVVQNILAEPSLEIGQASATLLMIGSAAGECVKVTIDGDLASLATQKHPDGVKFGTVDIVEGRAIVFDFESDIF